MGKSVFILGAGASAEAGGPLIADFLDRSWDIYEQGKAGDFEDSFELVFRAKAQLKAVHSMAHMNINNIETLFAAFEMSEILEYLGKLSKEDIAKLGDNVRRLILKTIEKRIRFQHGNGVVTAPTSYQHFLELVNKVAKRPSGSATIITFNYDLALDFAFQTNRIPFDYALPGMEESHGGIPLLKLHGSLNWAHCSKCSKLSYWILPTDASPKCWKAIDSSQTVADFSSMRRPCHHGCDNSLPLDPVIIPPTWSKAHHCMELRTVWQRAAKELSEAEDIFIIGYSWPSNDYFFHSLYSIGTISDEKTNFRRFWVFNPNADLAGHFKGMLGEIAEKRFRFYKHNFRRATDFLNHTLIQQASYIAEFEKDRII